METFFSWLALLGVVVGLGLFVEGVHRLIDYFFPTH